MKPYIVLCTFDDHGFETFYPIYKWFKKDPEVDVTLLLANNNDNNTLQDCHVKKEFRLGLKGTKYSLGNIKIERKPSVVVGFRLWWPPDRMFGVAARNKKIPVVMVNHGSMFVFNENQKYKRELYPAIVNCVWGQHDYDLWKKWTKDKIIITGNPLHDNLIKYKPLDIKTPKKFGLLLTPRDKLKIIRPAAENLNEILPVVAKCHPLDKKKNYYKKRFLTYTEAWTLLPLIYKASYILTNVSSALIPALYWKKPIFIFSFSDKGYYFKDFKDKFKDRAFNFKISSSWGNGELYNPIIPTVDDYKHFGHIPDGNNTKRVVEVIKSYV
jgi:hypothetical protein